jgi:F-type H+-transporting ATPase subunit epsilon
MGVLPGRVPLVGRLGYGELKITQAAGEEYYYIDGGFVQIKGRVVTLLTRWPVAPASS